MAMAVRIYDPLTASGLFQQCPARLFSCTIGVGTANNLNTHATFVVSTVTLVQAAAQVNEGTRDQL